MTEQEFLIYLKEMGLEISREQQKQLKLYASFLIDYNQHTNLTAIKTEQEIYLKHFYDSLTLYKIYHFQEETILDIGTGAGFPGLVLAICFPNVKVYLLDSNHKKIDFLKELITKLELKNAITVYDRAENYIRENRKKFDIVTSRAVAELRILIELAIPALKKNGFFLAMKSNVKKELSDSKDTLEILNSKVENLLEFNLPKENSYRSIIKIKKEKETETIYPREYRIIIKKPLKKKYN